MNMRYEIMSRSGRHMLDPLTEQDISQIQSAGRRLREDLQRVDELMIYHSPAYNSVQAARIIREELGCTHGRFRAESNSRFELVERANHRLEERVIEQIEEVVRHENARFPCIVIFPNLETYLLRNRDYASYNTIRLGEEG